MRSILMSIQPKWVAKILNGEKTIEIRKRFPKDYRGWVYIYCTKGEEIVYFGYGFGNTECLDTKEQIDLMREWKLGNWNDITWWLNKKDNERVVARFYCDNVEEIDYTYLVNARSYSIRSCLTASHFSKECCLEQWELDKYLQGKTGYAIHISQLDIFDKPKELCEFKYKKLCGYGFLGTYYATGELTKAPQSMMYIEVEE